MKTRCWVALFASASLFSFFLISPAQAWDPEEEVRQQNRQKNEWKRICSLIKTRPTHGTSGRELVYYVEGNTVYADWNIVFGCDRTVHVPRQFGKKYSRKNWTQGGIICQYMYKMDGSNLVEYRKCPGYTTAKQVFKRIGPSSSSSSNKRNKALEALMNY